MHFGCSFLIYSLFMFVAIKCSVHCLKIYNDSIYQIVGNKLEIPNGLIDGRWGTWSQKSIFKDSVITKLMIASAANWINFRKSPVCTLIVLFWYFFSSLFRRWSTRFFVDKCKLTIFFKQCVINWRCWTNWLMVNEKRRDRSRLYLGVHWYCRWW